MLEILLRQARSVTVTLLGEPDSREEIFEASLRTKERLVVAGPAGRAALGGGHAHRRGRYAPGPPGAALFGDLGSLTGRTGRHRPHPGGGHRLL